VIQEKTGKKIVFDVQGDLAALINRIKSRKRILTTHLFSLNDGRPLKKDNFNHQFIALKKRIGLHGVIKFHDLRSKAGTDVQEQGGDAQ
jgi:hypothetical protein